MKQHPWKQYEAQAENYNNGEIFIMLQFLNLFNNLSVKCRSFSSEMRLSASSICVEI